MGSVAQELLGTYLCPIRKRMRLSTYAWTSGPRPLLHAIDQGSWNKNLRLTLIEMEQVPDSSILRERIVDEVAATRRQVQACQEQLDLAAQQFSYGQAVLSEARDQLEASLRALDRLAMAL